ncbi:MAG TPA: ABC transporter permease [Gemmatimonadales bacterium]|nr:ABC transporter permease [Gemmatimonadales bacterium]
MILRNLDEGIGIALESLRSNKLRSALTILGVVIGVATVMAMASIVDGIRSQIFNAMNTAGPSAFYVVRFFSQTPLNPDHLPYEVRIRPVLEERDALAIRAVPEIQYAGIWVQVFVRLEYRGTTTQAVTVYGADAHYMDILGGTLLRGRFFTPADLSGQPVAVLEAESADRLFGREDPLGKSIRVGGVALRVVGIYQRPANIFEPPGQQIGAIVPFQTAKHSFRYDDTNGLFLCVKAWPSVPVPEAKDLTIAALRRARRLRPGMPNTFDVITQDQILDSISTLTSAFFTVMVALSSVALLVGGIGVMAIMMVSVTDRTREIGLRKALGATPREILWQFLVEAATLTLLGGLLGIATGLAAGVALKSWLRLPPGVPLWSAAVATVVSILIGLVFGLYPANRAARMDPIEALHHE